VFGSIGAAWGAAGVLGLLVAAIVRLAPRALEAYRAGLTAGQWASAGLFCAFMAYTEGYRGFQLRFSPRTAARIRHLRDRPAAVRAALAPAFAMGFFHATRRTKIAAWALTAAVILAVTLVQRLDQPWRGIVDFGVVVGLAWGVVSLVWSLGKALSGPDSGQSPQVPEGPRRGSRDRLDIRRFRT
jgi:hypothetical protein